MRPRGPPRPQTPPPFGGMTTYCGAIRPAHPASTRSAAPSCTTTALDPGPRLTRAAPSARFPHTRPPQPESLHPRFPARTAALRVVEPVFADAHGGVQIALGPDVLHPGIRQQDLHHQIRRPFILQHERLPPLQIRGPQIDDQVDGPDPHAFPHRHRTSGGLCADGTTRRPGRPRQPRQTAGTGQRAMPPMARAFMPLEGRELSRAEPTGRVRLGYAQDKAWAKGRSAAPTGLDEPFRSAGILAYASKNLIR